MPTKREREYYRMGFKDAMEMLRGVTGSPEGPAHFLALREMERAYEGPMSRFGGPATVSPRGRKRKLSAWNKFVRANSKKKEFRYRDGKLNLKKMGVAFRRKKRR